MTSADSGRRIAAQSHGITFWPLLCVAVGNIVGLRVMSAFGIGIALVGASLWVAVIAGGLLALVAVLPQALMSATDRFPGGQYEQLTRLGSPLLGGMYAYVSVLLIFNVTSYATSAAALLGLPGIGAKAVAIVMIALFCLLHAWGCKIAAWVQAIFTVALAATLGLFVVFLLPHASIGTLVANTFLGTPQTVAFVCVYMAYIQSGSAAVVNYAGQAAHPTRDIPRAIVTAAAGVTLLYALIAIADAGVLPIAKIANWNLNVAAQAFMPQWLAKFFEVGGSALALLTILNVLIGYIVHPLAAASADGWLPRVLAPPASQTKAPRRLLLVLFAASSLPILIGVGSGTVSSSTIVLIVLLQLVISLCALRLPTLLPQEWSSSHWHVNRTMLTVIVVAAVITNGSMAVWLLYTMNRLLIIANVALLVFAVIAACAVKRFASIKGHNISI